MIAIANTQGDGPIQIFPDGWNSLVTDVGSVIETFALGQTLALDVAGTVRIAGLVQVHGVGAQIDIDSNSIIMLLEGGLLARAIPTV